MPENGKALGNKGNPYLVHCLVGMISRVMVQWRLWLSVGIVAVPMPIMTV